MKRALKYLLIYAAGTISAATALEALGARIVWFAPAGYLEDKYQKGYEDGYDDGVMDLIEVDGYEEAKP